jgi:apolipoprotein N-acyltransferase
MRINQTVDKFGPILAIVSGVLLTCAFPKPGLAYLAWFALVPLLICVSPISDPKKSFRMGFLAGLVHFLTLFGYWLVPTMTTYGRLPVYVSVPVAFLAGAYLALYPAIFCAVLTYVCASPALLALLVPAIWVATEYLRATLLSGLPWELLGYTQYNQVLLIQIADVFGCYGVSFLIALSNAVLISLFLYLARKPWQTTKVTQKSLLLTAAIFTLSFGLVWVYGVRRINMVDKLMAAAPTANMAVVQGNIDQLVKWNPSFQEKTVQKYIELSLAIKADRPDLIIWPETATPFYFLYHVELSAAVFAGIKKADTDFLIGSPSFRRQTNRLTYYNSAYLIDRAGKVQSRYDKSHLVPFGEYIPLKKWLPFLNKIVEGAGDFQAGAAGAVLRWKKCALGPLICYEIIFPDLSRAMVAAGASLLINITNDAWYGRTSAPYQHFSMAVFRAVENKRALIRAANTGISGFIDPAGRIMAQTFLFTEAARSLPMPIIKLDTLYTRYGDLLPLMCFLAIITVALLKKCFRIGRQT